MEITVSRTHFTRRQMLQISLPREALPEVRSICAGKIDRRERPEDKLNIGRLEGRPKKSRGRQYGKLGREFFRKPVGNLDGVLVPVAIVAFGAKGAIFRVPPFHK